MMWRECIRKEWMESVKTARFWVIIAVFGAFGMLGPLTARYVNEIISAVAGDLGGIIGQLPPPSVTDSWMQFFKNMNQMCMLVMVLMFMTVVSGEKRRGSVLLVLSKGVGRTTFLCAKLTAAVLVYTIAYALALGLQIGYTWLLFGEIGNSGIWIGLFCFWCYGIGMLSLTLLTSTIARSTGIAAVLALGGYFVIQGIALFSKLGTVGGSTGLIPTISLYSPGAANGLALLIYDGLKQAGDGWISAGVSIVFATILFIVADRIFRRQEL
jgi:ABC-2 type transport system permease protein